MLLDSSELMSTLIYYRARELGGEEEVTVEVVQMMRTIHIDVDLGLDLDPDQDLDLDWEGRPLKLLFLKKCERRLVELNIINLYRNSELTTFLLYFFEWRSMFSPIHICSYTKQKSILFTWTFSILFSRLNQKLLRSDYYIFCICEHIFFYWILDLLQ